MLCVFINIEAGTQAESPLAHALRNYAVSCTFVNRTRFYQTFVDFMPNKSLILPNWNYIYYKPGACLLFICFMGVCFVSLIFAEIFTYYFLFVFFFFFAKIMKNEKHLHIYTRLMNNKRFMFIIFKLHGIMG